MTKVLEVESCEAEVCPFYYDRGKNHQAYCIHRMKSLGMRSLPNNKCLLPDKPEPITWDIVTTIIMRSTDTAGKWQAREIADLINTHFLGTEKF